MIQKIIFFAKKIKISLANIRKQKNSNYSFLIKLEYLLISTLFSYNFFRFRSKKFEKLFIYLSNVNDQNGAHIYLKRTHKNKPYVFSIPNYFSDNEVNNYSFENLKITGKIGTCFIEDTFGLHKAGYVNDGYRIMLAITYSKGKILWPHTSDNLIT
jgi:hypothetical protein